jgi:hypothetical protein
MVTELGRHGIFPDAPTPPATPAGFSTTDSDHRWRIRTVDGAIEVDETPDLPAAVGSAQGTTCSSTSRAAPPTDRER